MDESRHALIIANDTYQDEGLRRLVSPAEDAVALAGVLGDPHIGAFRVQVVRNEPAHVIAMRIDDFFADRRPGDTLVVHFSCHGLKSESGELYFAAANTLPRRLASTAVPASFVRRCMSVTRARSIALFLDCCYGGAFSQGVTARAAGDLNVLDSFSGEKLGGGRGWAVITASTSMEYAFEGARLADDTGPHPSVFTNALVSGLSTGEADLDEDGRVSLDELYEYVYDRVRQENPNQTPSRSVDLQGDLYLARSHRRRITPAPVPDDVRAAMRSADIYTRLGAITELRARMENADLSIAAGAREALAEMARHDIRAVAEEARRAVSEVRVNPYPSSLRFDPVRQHADPPRQTVRLLGPPLARSCAPHPKPDWLRAVETPEGLEVCVETSGTGRLSGDIVLKGVAGESVVHVDAEVLPAEETATEGAPAPEAGPEAAPEAVAEEAGADEAGAEQAGAEEAGAEQAGAEGTPEAARSSPEAPTRPSSPPPTPPAATPPSREPPQPRPAPERPASAEAPTMAWPVPPPPPPPQPEQRRPSPSPSPEPQWPAAEARRERARPATPAGGGTRYKALRAPALGVGALALAIASLATGIKAVIDALALARAGHAWEPYIRDHLDKATMGDLVFCLIAALVSLALVGLARYDLRNSTGLYSKQSSATTSLLAWSAKLLALPVFIVAVLAIIAVLVVV
ncbi:caspase family protein [Streptomyces ficellus]|uniref:Caspase family protein n=1 Tax=Streptomyces ficellus TaxID=1977088 RepID=A0ABT7Z6I0_9ACTN|nr:caspase family protein [Streptomyces ficellus]MDN3295075.1 caspase family protein [Streptomyces ficellus]